VIDPIALALAMMTQREQERRMNAERLAAQEDAAWDLAGAVIERIKFEVRMVEREIDRILP
jgi:hypothetical protein